MERKAANAQNLVPFLWRGFKLKLPFQCWSVSSLTGISSKFRMFSHLNIIKPGWTWTSLAVQVIANILRSYSLQRHYTTESECGIVASDSLTSSFNSVLKLHFKKSELWFWTIWRKHQTDLWSALLGNHNLFIQSIDKSVFQSLWYKFPFKVCCVKIVK